MKGATMPVGPFPDYNTCVIELGKDPKIENPQKLCGWMEEQGKSEDVKPGDLGIYNFDVQFVSFVDTPAVMDSQFVKRFKSANPAIQSFSDIREILIKTKEFDNDGVVYAPALIPNKVDGNHEGVPDWEIKKAAHKYMEQYRKVDAMHDFKDGVGVPVESWILRQDEQWERPNGTKMTYPKGTWMMAIKVKSVEIWNKILTGEIKGLSIAGNWAQIPLKSLYSQSQPDTETKEKSTMDEKDMKQIEELLTKNLAAHSDSIKALVSELKTSNETSTKALVETLTKSNTEIVKAFSDNVKPLGDGIAALLKAKEPKDEEEEEDKEKPEGKKPEEKAKAPEPAKAKAAEPDPRISSQASEPPAGEPVKSKGMKVRIDGYKSDLKCELRPASQ
jgi:hypothetical protein